MLKYVNAAIVAGLFLCNPGHAQQTATPPVQVAVIQPAQQQNILRAGTEIPLTMREELTTKKKAVRVGQRFQLEVSSSVTQNGVVIIPAGTPVIGEITQVRNKGMWGKSGYIGARVISLRLGDRQIRLTGTFDDKGVTGTGGVVAAVAFVPIAGFVTTGTSALIPLGAPVKSFLDEDVPYTAAMQAPIVPATAQAPVQPAGATVQNAVLKQ